MSYKVILHQSSKRTNYYFYSVIANLSLMEFCHQLQDEYLVLNDDIFQTSKTRAAANKRLQQMAHKPNPVLFSLGHPPKSFCAIGTWLSENLPSMMPLWKGGIMGYTSCVQGINIPSMLAKNSRYMSPINLQANHVF